MSDANPFVIYALPRSRTAWLSRFLTYGPWTCGHDVVTDLHSVDGLRAFFATPGTGSAETGMVVGWRLVQAYFPDARVVVVRRPVDEVAASLARFGIVMPEGHLETLDSQLAEVARQPAVLSVSFADLADERVCRRIWEHCLDLPFDSDWWRRWAPVDVQIDMPARLAKLAANHAGIEALKAEMAAQLECLP